MNNKNGTSSKLKRTSIVGSSILAIAGILLLIPENWNFWGEILPNLHRWINNNFTLTFEISSLILFGLLLFLWSRVSKVQSTLHSVDSRLEKVEKTVKKHDEADMTLQENLDEFKKETKAEFKKVHERLDNTTKTLNEQSRALARIEGYLEGREI